MGLRERIRASRIEEINRRRQDRLRIANYVLASAQGKFLTDTTRSEAARDRIHAINTDAYSRIVPLVSSGAVAASLDREQAVHDLVAARDYLLAGNFPGANSRIKNDDIWANAGLLAGSPPEQVEQFFTPLIESFKG